MNAKLDDAKKALWALDSVISDVKQKAEESGCKEAHNDYKGLLKARNIIESVKMGEE